MRPLYESLQDDFEIYERQSVHFSPQIHNFVECFYITQGTFELGLDQHLYHMEAGDFAIIFPGTIHHSQVFDPGPCTNIDMLFSTSYTGVFSDTLLQNRQIDPVIQAKDLHPDVPYAIHSLFQDKQAGKLSQVLVQSWVQIILTRCMAVYKLEPRSATVNNDLIFRSVSYIAEHFAEPITLTKMAKDLYVSPYAISRMFSGTFHTNFNGYLNDTRIEYICSLLRYTDQSITEAYINAGFESQRTFNRVFQEKMHMTPREYRIQSRGLQGSKGLPAPAPEKTGEHAKPAQPEKPERS